VPKSNTKYPQLKKPSALNHPMKKPIGFIFSLIVSVSCVANAATNIVTNGDFALGGLGWNLTRAASGSILDYLSGPPSCAGFGANQLLDDTISQSLSTVPGNRYSISFQLNVGTVHVGGNDNGNDFRAAFGGSTLFSATNIAQQDYTAYAFTAVAGAAFTDLVFSGRNGPNYSKLTGVVVQNISPVITASLPANTGSIVLSWPTNAVGFKLMQTTNLLPSAWSVVTNMPTVINTNFTVTFPLGWTTGFFRLQE
jgi:hypothetical protein